mgnify:CR=1 FL=1
MENYVTSEPRKGPDPASVILGIFIGAGIGILILYFACKSDREKDRLKWKTLMVECGCAAYDRNTGEWYSFNKAPTPLEDEE